MEEMGRRAAQVAARVRFSLVCKVVTPRFFFRRRSFIDLFTRLWGGERGVSISDVEDDWFLVRFSCEEDLVRVLDKEPWDFDKALIVMERLKETDSVTDVVLNTEVFWVQAHGVPFRYRIPEVALDIGGMVGEFLEVTSDADGNCFGRFFRFKVRMDITIALLQCMVAEFPRHGEQLIEFKYERLPEFCQECGIIGHPTRICDEKLGLQGKTDSERPFSLKLRADMDLHGNRLGVRVSRGRFGSLSGEVSDGGSSSQSWTRTDGGNDIERGGQTVVHERMLQLEGPTQDTASSPVKSVIHKNSNHEVVPVKKSDAHIRLLHLEDLMAENEKFLHMEEDKGGVAVTLCSSAKLDATVPQTAKKTRQDGSSLDIKLEEILKLGAVMRATFDNSKTMECNVSLSGIIDHECDVVKDVKVENPVLAMKFSVGSHTIVVDKDKKAGRKMVKVNPRRKLVLNSESEKCDVVMCLILDVNEKIGGFTAQVAN
ncbi:hypothetical protein M0R45_019484 [Rubus argutus]|uniref:CCHC-type domain-containing protein n=1 Tax=Rubus argutus TaxID=59490 RepID=A0AAW1X7C2_RUBAR